MLSIQPSGSKQRFQFAVIQPDTVVQAAFVDNDTLFGAAGGLVHLLCTDGAFAFLLFDLGTVIHPLEKLIGLRGVSQK